MTREDLNKKRDELMELFSEKTKVADQGLAFYDKRFGFEQGFNACTDILLPEIERNKVLVGYVRTNGHTIVETNAMADKITQLEKENASLKDDLETVRSSLNFRNLTAISRADRLDSKDDKITQLEKEVRDLNAFNTQFTRADKRTWGDLANENAELKDKVESLNGTCQNTLKREEKLDIALKTGDL